MFSLGLVLQEAINLTNSKQCLFTVEVIYTTLLTLIKLSIIAMYRRVFPTTLIWRGCHVLGSMVLAWWVAVTLVTFLQCRPLKALWDYTILDAKRMNSLSRKQLLVLFFGHLWPVTTAK
jgi:hypothetical protein